MIISGKIAIAGSQCFSPASITLANSAKDAAKDSRPSSMTGLRPQRSLFLPQ